jgi:hypothetical protein
MMVFSKKPIKKIRNQQKFKKFWTVRSDAVSGAITYGINRENKKNRKIIFKSIHIIFSTKSEDCFY